MRKEKIIRYVKVFYEKYMFSEELYNNLEKIKEEMVARISMKVYKEFPNKMFNITFSLKEYPQHLRGYINPDYTLTCTCNVYEEVLNNQNQSFIYNNFNFVENGDNNV